MSYQRSNILKSVRVYECHNSMTTVLKVDDGKCESV